MHRLIYNIQSIYYLEIDIALQFHKRRLNRHGNDANELRYGHDYFAFHPRISLVSRAAGQTFSCREIAAPLSEMEAGQMWSSVIVCSTCHGKKKKKYNRGKGGGSGVVPTGYAAARVRLKHSHTNVK